MSRRGRLCGIAHRRGARSVVRRTDSVGVRAEAACSMTNIPLISEEARDSEALASFVAAAMAEKPLAWQRVELLKDACEMVESQHRMLGDRIGPSLQSAGDWR